MDPARGDRPAGRRAMAQDEQRLSEEGGALCAQGQLKHMPGGEALRAFSADQCCPCDRGAVGRDGVMKAWKIAPPDHATGADAVGSQRPPGTPTSVRWGSNTDPGSLPGELSPVAPLLCLMAAHLDPPLLSPSDHLPTRAFIHTCDLPSSQLSWASITAVRPPTQRFPIKPPI